MSKRPLQSQPPLPKPLREFAATHAAVAAAYEQLGEAVRSAGPLSPRDVALVMGVGDAGHLAHLRDEMRSIQLAVEAGRAVLGICLGSQLLAATLGASVRPGARKEIGWYPVTLTDVAGDDALFRGMPATFTAFHWHSDVFSLPDGAVSLASSEATVCQAFRWRKNVYGLLFHPQVDRTGVGQMVNAFADEVQEAGVDARGLIDPPPAHFGALRRIGDVVFGRWADLPNT